MDEALRKSNRKSCESTNNVTFSQESQDGRSHSDSQEYRQTFLFSQEVFPVKDSPSPASEKVWTTNETCGPTSSISFASANLQSSLESRLKERLPTDGLIECNLTWSEKVTPSGVPYCLLRASGHRTSGTESSGVLFPYPTCTLGDARNAKNRTANRSIHSQHHDGQTLIDVVGLVIYPTPKRDDGSKSIRSEQGVINEYKRKGVNDLNTAVGLAVYPTPTALSFNESHQPGNNRYVNQMMEMCAPWATPMAADDGHKVTVNSKQPGLIGMAQLMPGPTTESSDSETASTVGYLLNPAMSRWLMGYPETWDVYSPDWSDWASWQEILNNLSSEPSETESAD